MSSYKWFDKYFDAVYSYILLQVKHVQTAEDLAQETFIKVIAKKHQFKEQSSVKTWIFRIAYTTVISHFRKKHPLTHFIDLPSNNSLLDISAEKTALLNFQHKEFYEALGKLKPSLLIIQDVFIDMGDSLMGKEDEEPEKYQNVYAIPEPALPAGEFEDFKIEREGDRYTLRVKGDKSFTYQLTKIAPRKYIGEDGVEFNTPFYIDGEPE